MFDLETQIRQWRDHLRSRSTLSSEQLEELEIHLRDGVDDLVERGILQDEAFLVMVRRLGEARELNVEFAKVPAERVWSQLLVPADSEQARLRQSKEVVLVACLALGAVVVGKILDGILGGISSGLFTPRQMTNMAFLAFAPVLAYLAWTRSLSWKRLLPQVIVFVVMVIIMNAYPSRTPHHTHDLSALHAPIVLWTLVALTYCGSQWRRSEIRLDFVRFSGEVFIYGVLVMLGGFVLLGLGQELFRMLNLDIQEKLARWIIPAGVWSLPVVAAFLVERKMGRMESLAPVLAKIFVPLFLILFLALLGSMAILGTRPSQDRDMLVIMDALLALVLGLVLYTMSARDALEEARWTDGMILALVLAAVLIDAVSITGVLGRLVTYGFSANKTAALGMNLIILVNLLILAFLYGSFLFRKGSYRTIVHVQMRFLPLYAFWALAVSLVFPILFAFS